MATISAILTAAGESTRMGTPKPLLDWKGVPLIEYQISTLIEAGLNEIVVVLGHERESVEPLVHGEGVHSVYNPDYRLGRSTSVRLGAENVALSSKAILLLGVDQPRSPDLVSKIINFHMNKGLLITSPEYNRRGGHPIIFSSELKDELMTVTEKYQGVRKIFISHNEQISKFICDDPTVRLDMNTPNDYSYAHRCYGSRK
jgi:molybdenum cofactor cytidylyltransferase